MPEPTDQPDPVADFLRTVPASNRVRAAAWDAANAADPTAKQAGIAALPLPQSVKAQLFEISTTPTQPPTSEKTIGQHLSEGAGTLWETVNPLNVVHAVNQAVLPEQIGNVFGYEKSGPINTLNQMLGHTGRELYAAGQSAVQGRPG